MQEVVAPSKLDNSRMKKWNQVDLTTRISQHSCWPAGAVSVGLLLLLIEHSSRERESLKGQTRRWWVSRPSKSGSSSFPDVSQTSQGLTGDGSTQGSAEAKVHLASRASHQGLSSLVKSVWFLQFSAGHQSSQGRTSVVSSAWRRKRSTARTKAQTGSCWLLC